MFSSPSQNGSKQAVEAKQSYVSPPPAVSLPKGGGAIKGMGEKFAANPVTGTGSMTVPIATSPGRSEFGPQLSLDYDSGAGNGPFGFGWNLSLPSITRKTDKGIPQYRDSNDGEESDVFVLSGAEDLVPLLVEVEGKWQPEKLPVRTVEGEIFQIRRYRPRIEGLFARIERWTNLKTGETHWRSLSKDNILTLYGKDANSRITDPKDPTRIFSWLICETRDDKGNGIIYEYKSEDGVKVDLAQAHEGNRGDRLDPRRTANRYLKRILYGNQVSLLNNTRQRPSFLTQAEIDNAGWLFEVIFDYGEHDLTNPKPGDAGEWSVRNDPFSSYRSGFEVRTYRLCQRVLMFHHFPDEEGVGQNCLVRSTDFTYSYEQNPTDVRNPIYSFLLSVTQTGYKRNPAGGYTQKSLPPLEFTYSQPQIDETVHEVEPTSLENLPQGLDGSRYQWVDLDGEGLAGILTEQGEGWFYKRNLSPINAVRKNGDRQVEARLAPVERVASKPMLDLTGGAQFLDLAGDGQPDLVALRSATPGFYERTHDRGWETFVPFKSLPRVDWENPNLKFIDLNGDGHSDILITEDDCLVWHRSLAEEGFGEGERTYPPWHEEKGSRVLFADSTQSIYLSDMSGDGLADIVRIRNGEVCYWPNLGYGRFGSKVIMDNAPWFDASELFNQRRIVLADIDGSGTTDILYLSGEGVQVYFNQSGNSWSAKQVLRSFPPIDSVASVTAIDLLGNGTACLVWSSPLTGSAGRAMRYIDLMGGQKPHLLIKTVNNLGAETIVQYAPSTQFYLQDELDGKPWITKLPFPVQVVERVETGDRLSGNRFVTRYAYHHGYFDGEEREFRGFAFVEQWDTEDYPVFRSGEGTNALEKSLHLPPVHTKTWFHTGAFRDREHISNFLAAKEYYREPQHRIPDHVSQEERRKREEQFQNTLLPDTILPDGLTDQEQREACRALKGQVLRQEIYAVDGSEQSQHPYSVSEQNYQIRQLQPRQKSQYAVFFTHPHETINYHYERNPDDPRISHEMTLEVDEFGNVLKSAAIGYPRRKPQYEEQGGIKTQGGELSKKEGKPLITYQENWLVNHPNAKDGYRIGVTIESRTYEITGLSVEIKEIVLGNRKWRYFVPYSLDFIQEKLKVTAEIDYEEKPESGQLQKRLIECSRTLYRKDAEANTTDPTAPLKLGQIESLALPYESYEMTFSQGLLEVYDSSKIQIDSSTPSTPEAFRSNLEGLLRNEGKYVKSKDLKDQGLFLTQDKDGDWWIPSGRQAFAPKKFYLPIAMKDPFDKNFLTTYDNYVLLVTQTQDPLKNILQVTNNYRVMQPEEITDPNGNRDAVSFDALGMVVATAAMGKAGETDPKKMGDTLDNPTTTLEYDLFNWKQHQRPVFVKTRAREEHRSPTTRWQESYTYSDGFGREIQTKVQAEPGKAPLRDPDTGQLVRENGELKFGRVSSRWVGTGRIIYNNKGKPVKQYEPFFSSTHEYETEQDLVEWGVTPILFYDPLERVVATLHPNHSYEKVVFDPWQQTTWDVNDTVVQADPKTDPDVGHFFQVLPDEEYLPTWHTLRTDAQMALVQWPDVDPQTRQRLPGNAKIRAAEKAAAEKAAIHGETPTIGHLDTLGRPFLTIAHNKFQKPDSTTGNVKIVEEKYPTRVKLDIEGNPLVITDARHNPVMEYAYDMSGPDEDEEGEEEDTHRLYLKSMDAGERWTLNNVAGNPIRTWDSRQQQFRYKYDGLQRPTHLFVRYERQETVQEILAERTVYGEEVANGVQFNLRGEVYQQYDGAGVKTNHEYDFKGNLKHSSRQLAKDYKQRVDWKQAQLHTLTDVETMAAGAKPLLETEIFTWETKYDALVRPIRLKMPDQSEVKPTYNEANFLDKVEVRLRGKKDEENKPIFTQFVKNIDYDAKGQRTLIVYGSGVKTDYTYDRDTFRVTHLLTTAENGKRLQDLHYTYDPVGNITAIRDDAQQTIFFNNQVVTPSSKYEYDALYRLIKAEGREHLGQTGDQLNRPVPTSDTDVPRVNLPHPGDGKAMGRYLQEYVYDPVGNILEMIHGGTNPVQPGWRRCYQYAVDSNRLLSTGYQNDPGVACSSENHYAETSVYPDHYKYDPHGNMTKMPHLKEMEWDFDDQLQSTAKQVVNNGGTPEITYYTYDSSGQRVRKVTEGQAAVGGQSKRMKERIYLDGFEVYREYKGNGDDLKLKRETLHVMDDEQRIALVETKTFDVEDSSGGAIASPKPVIRYQLNNHLGSASLQIHFEKS